MIIQSMPYPETVAAGSYVGGKVAAATRGTGTTTVSLTDLTGGLATAPSEGDLVIAAYAIISPGGSNRDVQVTPDFTEVADLYSTDTFASNLGVFYKFMGATPDTNLVLGPTVSSTYAGHVAIHVWRGVSVASPMDVAAVPATGINSKFPNPGAITPTTPGAIIIVAGTGSGNGINFAVPSDLSNFVTGWSSEVASTNIGMGSASWVGGQFDPVTWALLSGGDSTSHAWCACTLALRPA